MRVVQINLLTFLSAEQTTFLATSEFEVVLRTESHALRLLCGELSICQVMPSPMVATHEHSSYFLSFQLFRHISEFHNFNFLLGSD